MSVGGGPTVPGGTPTMPPKVVAKPAPPSVAPKPTLTSPSPEAAPGMIPLPNYADPKSRDQYAQNFYNKYPQLGHGNGDIPLRVNESPEYGSGTSKQMAIDAAKKAGVDPAILYSSAMVEGMSGLYKDKDGNIETGAHVNDKYPVSGYANFGLDTFGDKFKDLVAKGYLPKDFAQNFSPSKETNEKGQSVNSANFKDVNSALQAKAAMLKQTYDDIDSYAKQRKITLSPKARDFFALADYNGGEGTGHQMLNDYYNNGQLEGDKFLQARPTSGKGLKADSYKDVYNNVIQRVAGAYGLKEQKLFD